MKWYSMSQYIDIDTGELLGKHTAETNYTIIKKSKKIETNGSTRIVTITNECRRKPKQLKLEY